MKKVRHKFQKSHFLYHCEQLHATVKRKTKSLQHDIQHTENFFIYLLYIYLSPLYINTRILSATFFNANKILREDN